MPWKRGRSGMRSFVVNRRPYKSVGRKRKARVGSFKRRVRAIAKSVVHRQADLKHYDRLFTNIGMNSSIGFNSIALTAGPSLNTTGSTRIGSKIRAHKVVVNFTTTAATALATNAGQQSRIRVIVVELLDQNDTTNFTNGTAFWDVNSADVDANVAPNKMTAFVNLRKYKVLYDKQYMLGAPATSTLPSQMPTFVHGRYIHDFKGQEWIFNGIADGEFPNNRLVGMVWIIESADQSRLGANDVTASLDVNCRVYFTD